MQPTTPMITPILLTHRHMMKRTHKGCAKHRIHPPLITDTSLLCAGGALIHSVVILDLCRVSTGMQNTNIGIYSKKMDKSIPNSGQHSFQDMAPFSLCECPVRNLYNASDVVPTWFLLFLHQNKKMMNIIQTKEPCRNAGVACVLMPGSWAFVRLQWLEDAAV